MIRLCNVQLEYFGFLWNYFQSTPLSLSRGFLEWETTWITKLKKVKGFWSFTFKSSTWLKELDLLLRCCLLYVGLHILILTDQHSGSPAMVDNEHWGTISNPRNLALKVEEEWGSLVYNPQLFIIKQSPIKIFYLGTNFALFLTREGSWSHSVFFALLQVLWCCHRAGDTYCLKELVCYWRPQQCANYKSEKFRFNTKKYEIIELIDWK